MRMEPRDETSLMATLARKNAVLEGINRIFHEALTAPSLEALGRVCLRVAEDVTGASFSFMGEIDRATDLLDEIAISERGWAAFEAAKSDWPQGEVPTGLTIHGLYGRVLREGKALIFNDAATHDDRIGTPAGHPPLESFLGVPLHQNGAVLGMVGLGNRPGGFRDEDLAAAEELAPAIVQALHSKRAEMALRDSEEQRRLTLELVPAMLWRVDLAGLRIASNQQWHAITGQTDEQASNGGWMELIHPSEAGKVSRAFRRAYAAGEPVTVQCRVRQAEGGYRAVLIRQVPVRDGAGQITHWFGAATDISDMHSLEERQRVLVAELQHRVRNILTVVRSVFARTVEGSESLEDVADHFRGRLDALARTQVSATLNASGTVDLENLIRDELLSVGVSDGPGLIMAGPDVALPADAVELLGLAIHELATNALKFGAFRAPGGSLSIAWDVNVDGRSARRLDLSWTEQGVPAVPIQPTRQGFGTELIEEALPYRLGAETRLEFRGGGVRCTIGLPLGGDEEGA
ncbi:GAF domain-containing protein [Sphingomonas yunnanensis]|uniref:GAF domain-containing protein n=1 Tax=Sphingomonas yunnanensis TaxID=310400 RepID=UPI001CA61FEA|nr:GAF domain-containing protein [Sphingomonas yunnanensis]MBY9063261.1 GAF domain-containing protein [Sphingomonas yunnanensis]